MEVPTASVTEIIVRTWARETDRMAHADARASPGAAGMRYLGRNSLVDVNRPNVKRQTGAPRARPRTRYLETKDNWGTDSFGACETRPASNPPTTTTNTVGGNICAKTSIAPGRRCATAWVLDS